MSNQNQQQETQEAISYLLTDSQKVSRKIYNNAIFFLALGLIVAAGGVVYFYFSNDALFLDRVVYQNQINKLEVENSNLNRDISLLASAYEKEDSLVAEQVSVVNKSIRVNRSLTEAYAKLYLSFYNDVYQHPGKIPDFGKLEETYNYHSTKFSLLDQQIDKYPKLIKQINTQSKEANEITKRFNISKSHPLKSKNVVNPYDQPDLVFSPKLVYGFLTRVSGLIFIEIIAFYLLRQYRINMNDFKEYDALVRQIRTNLYLVNVADPLEFNRDKIDLISSIMNATISKPVSSQNEETDSISSSDLEQVNKFLLSIKELLKK